jgi:hypothetical protein
MKKKPRILFLLIFTILLTSLFLNLSKTTALADSQCTSSSDIKIEKIELVNSSAENIKLTVKNSASNWNVWGYLVGKNEQGDIFCSSSIDNDLIYFGSGETVIYCDIPYNGSYSFAIYSGIPNISSNAESCTNSKSLKITTETDNNTAKAGAGLTSQDDPEVTGKAEIGADLTSAGIKFGAATGVINFENTFPSFAGLTKQTNTVVQTAMGIAGGIAFLLIVIGAFQIILSAGNPDRVKAGKEMITAALAGLFLIIFSVFILKLIGADILQIPGFE